MRVLLLLGVCVSAFGQMPTCSTALWSPCDLVFSLQAGEDSADATLRVEFRSPHRDTKNIRAFRDGLTFVIRFTPDEVGEWDYRVTSSVKRFDGQTGQAMGTASTAPGFVRPATTLYFQTTTAFHHFQTTNLQPHLWMGT